MPDPIVPSPDLPNRNHTESNRERGRSDVGACMKIAVRCNNWIGDVVMSLPALASVRRHYPDAEIVAITRPWARDLLSFVPDLIDRVIDFDEKGDDRGLTGLWRFSRKLVPEQFDLGLVFTRHARGIMLMQLARVNKVYGFSVVKRLLGSRGDQSQTKRHQKHRYLDLVAGLGVSTENIEVKLRIPASLSDVSRRFLQHVPRPHVFFHAGAAYGTAKRWTIKGFVEAAKGVTQAGGQVILLGVAEESDVNLQIQAACPSVYNLCGKTTLRESIALLASADAFLGNDSGLMHVVAAWQRPQVTIFGPTDELESYPDNPFATTIAGEAHCRPCHLRDCPIDHMCMKSVPTDRVIHALKQAITVYQTY